MTGKRGGMVTVNRLMRGILEGRGEIKEGEGGGERVSG